MSYCIQYSTKFKYFDDERVAEVLVNSSTELEEMKKFCEVFPHKTVVLQFNDGIDAICLRNLIELKKSYANFKALFVNDKRLRTYTREHKEEFEHLKENEIPFFFNNYISDWDEVYLLTDLGVSDMYIVENLCFELDKVHELLSEKNIQVRVFPNVAQSKYKYDIFSFFIRPEDRELYDEYVDIYEFYGYTDRYTDNTYFKVYADNEQWLGELGQLIIGLEDELDSRFVIPKFGEFRIRCGKRCLKGHSCRMCRRVQGLAETLEEAGLTVKSDN